MRLLLLLLLAAATAATARDAFVTYVYGAVTRHTLVALRMWREALERDGVDYVVIVPAPDAPAWAAATSNIRVIPSNITPPTHCVDGSNPDEYASLAYYGGSYLALDAFSLTEYATVAVVDTDILVRSSDVFGMLPDEHDVAASLDWPQQGSLRCDRTAPPYYQLGIFLAHPNASAAAAVITYMNAAKTRCTLAVQDGLNEYWAAVGTRVACLPPSFNCQPVHTNKAPENSCAAPDVRFVHFSGPLKPWTPHAGAPGEAWYDAFQGAYETLLY